MEKRKSNVRKNLKSSRERRFGLWRIPSTSKLWRVG